VLFCDRQSFVIRVAAASANAVPAIVPPGLENLTVAVGDAVAIDVAPAFTDPDGDPLRYTATGLPAGLSLIDSVISGVALTAAGSPHTIAIDANDGRGGIVRDTFELTIVPLVTADLAIESITITPAPGRRGVPIEWQIDIVNNGPSTSAEAELGLVFSGSAIDLTAGECTAGAVAGDQRLTCQVATLPAGGHAVTRIQATPAQRGDVWMSANLAAPASPADPDESNNSQSAALNIGDSVVESPAQALDPGAILSLASADFDQNGTTVWLAAATDGRVLLFPSSESPDGLAPELSGPNDQRRGLGSAMPLLPNAGARKLALGDLDGDGRPDLAVAAASGTASRLYLNPRDGELQPAASLGSSAANDGAVAVSDLNGDGLLDIVVAGSGSIRAWLFNGDVAGSARQAAL
jgi:hypothetical protein